MEGWKIGGIASFSLVTIVYGLIIFIFANQGKTGAIFSVLKTYPALVLIFVPVGVVIGLIVSAINFFLKPKKSKKKRGQIWVSTVLYIALGIVAMTLILSAGLPMIAKMKDRNTFIESKTIMHTIQAHISTVVSEGPGSRRVLDPVIIKGGKLIFDVDNEEVRWEMKTGTLLMEACPLGNVNEGVCEDDDYIQNEGGLKFYLAETFVVDEYVINILLDYGDIDLVYAEDNEITGSLTGNYMIAISNAATVGDITVEILIS